MGRIWLFASLSAGATLLAFEVPLLGPPMIFAAISLQALLATRFSGRACVAAVLVTQCLLYLILNRWMAAVSALGYPLQALAMAGYAWLWLWLVRQVTARARRRPLHAGVAAALITLCVEALRGRLLLDGYPWFLAAHPLASWPVMIQAADLVGASGVGAIVACSAGSLAAGDQRVRRKLVHVLVPIALLGSYGAWRWNQDALDASTGLRALAIQTNLRQDNKIGWTFEEAQRDFFNFIALTEEAVRQTRVRGESIDLIIWPETMVPGFGLDDQTVHYLRTQPWLPGPIFADALNELAERVECPLLVGSSASEGLRVDSGRWARDKAFNSAYLLRAGASPQRYDKMALTPFGEVIPYVWRWPELQNRIVALGAKGMKFDLEHGERPVRFDVEAGAERTKCTVAAPICFETAMPMVCRRLMFDGGRRQADVLVNLSNDGWFGECEAARRQFVNICRFRCVEARAPMVRSANTGLSVAIDSRGKLIAGAGGDRYGRSRESGWTSASLPRDRRNPFYPSVGEWPGTISVGAVFALLILDRLGRRHGSPS